MTHSETTRVNDLIALQIGSIQNFARQLTVDSELQKLESILASLKKESAALQQTLKAIPHTPTGRATKAKARSAPRKTSPPSGHKVHHEIFPHVSGDEGNLS